MESIRKAWSQMADVEWTELFCATLMAMDDGREDESKALAIRLTRVALVKEASNE